MFLFSSEKLVQHKILKSAAYIYIYIYIYVYIYIYITGYIYVTGCVYVYRYIWYLKTDFVYCVCYHVGVNILRLCPVLHLFNTTFQNWPYRHVTTLVFKWVTLNTIMLQLNKLRNFIFCIIRVWSWFYTLYKGLFRFS